MPFTFPDFPAADIPVQHVRLPWLDAAGLSLAVLRADLIDPLLGGNKYFKLKYNLDAARRQGTARLLSFGGPWSNHLHALAAAGRRFGFGTIGIVRGAEPAPPTACLQDARAMGMQLHFVTRATFRRREEPGLHAELKETHGDFLLIPEGGANLAGIRGCQELAAALAPEHWDQVLLAAGTGTTLTGLVTATSIPVTGIQVLKGTGYVRELVASKLRAHGLEARAPWQVRDEFHEGGYARASPALLDFMRDFCGATGIPLEPVYTGKLLFAVMRMAQAGSFARGARLLAIHGGGLQGARGWPQLAGAAGVHS